MAQLTERDKMHAAFQAGVLRHPSHGQIERSFSQWYSEFQKRTRPAPAKLEVRTFCNNPKGKTK